MSSSSPLNDKISNLVVMSSLSPLNRQIAKSPFCLLLYPVRYLWTVNTPSLVISNRLCPICHLWTDEYPISSFFIIMSSLSPLNDKISSLVASQSVMSSLSPLSRQITKSPFCLLLCPVRHLWIVNTPSLVILNRLRPCDLWTDR